HPAAGAVHQRGVVLPVSDGPESGEPAMALTKYSRSGGRRPGRFWSRLHFLIRFLGLTGLLAGCAGLVLAHLDGLLTSWDALWGALQANAVSAWLLAAGGGAVLLALLVETGVVLSMTAARRSALGFNAAVQVALAVVLLVGVNVISAVGINFEV